eukprot:scaffold1955_cov122-Skeletonema_marinoi.AAC.10
MGVLRRNREESEEEDACWIGVFHDDVDTTLERRYEMLTRERSVSANASSSPLWVAATFTITTYVTSLPLT